MNNTHTSQARFLDYLELCKPRVVALMVLTAIVAMLLASPTGTIPWSIIIYASLGISAAAGAGGCINHLIDRKIDAVMARTKGRPLPTGRIRHSRAVLLATVLSVGSMLIMFTMVNALAAILTLLTLIGYAGVYTLVLKRATPQNIVIGGLAGAMPPLLGWSSVTGSIEASALLLVLIIFTWTPPHFWALAIHRHKEYAQANLPMLPVTHGIRFTKINILLYTFLMIVVTYLAFAINMFGLIYLVGLTLLNAAFLYYVIRLYRGSGVEYALKTFHFSITYLGLLFLLMLADHYLSVFI